MLALLALARRELGGTLLAATPNKVVTANSLTSSAGKTSAVAGPSERPVALSATSSTSRVVTNIATAPAQSISAASTIGEVLHTISAGLSSALTSLTAAARSVGAKPFSAVSSMVTSVVNFVVGVNPAASTVGTAVGFSGQPSLLMSIAVLALRLAKPVEQLLGIDFTTTIAPAIASTSPPWLLTLGLHVTKTEYDGMDVYEIASFTPSGDYVVAVHGGAYAVQPTLLHWLSYTTTVRATNATVVVPIYPQISQGGNAATVVPEIAGLISQQINIYGVDKVSVVGDSAGGGLALAAVQLMVSQNMPVPKSLVLQSPWLDVTMSNPAIARIDDPVLNRRELVRDGLAWAGDLGGTDPLVSPVYGSMAGLPPTYIYSGSDDLLSADALVLQQKAIAAGAPISFILRRGEIHDWALLPILDGGQVQDQIYRELGLVGSATGA
jgi:acetyl esterase/lipase